MISFKFTMHAVIRRIVQQYNFGWWVPLNYYFSIRRAHNTKIVTYRESEDEGAETCGRFVGEGRTEAPKGRGRSGTTIDR